MSFRLRDIPGYSKVWKDPSSVIRRIQSRLAILLVPACWGRQQAQHLESEQFPAAKAYIACAVSEKCKEFNIRGTLSLYYIPSLNVLSLCCADVILLLSKLRCVTVLLSRNVVSISFHLHVVSYLFVAKAL